MENGGGYKESLHKGMAVVDFEMFAASASYQSGSPEVQSTPYLNRIALLSTKSRSISSFSHDVSGASGSASRALVSLAAPCLLSIPSTILPLARLHRSEYVFRAYLQSGLWRFQIQGPVAPSAIGWYLRRLLPLSQERPGLGRAAERLGALSGEH